jgi:hypothetical protein
LRVAAPAAIENSRVRSTEASTQAEVRAIWDNHLFCPNGRTSTSKSACATQVAGRIDQRETAVGFHSPLVGQKRKEESLGFSVK